MCRAAVLDINVNMQPAVCRAFNDMVEEIPRQGRLELPLSLRLKAMLKVHSVLHASRRPFTHCW